ncbi:MAG: family 43 glycosylhydrolase [Prevotella sp.]|nr:family 43 glycosylhydrolase [Prevotella sp.]
MKRIFVGFVVLLVQLLLAPWSLADDRQQMTRAKALSMIGNATMRRVSVHDPSVVWEPQSQKYYVFGSHRAAARTGDLAVWTPFTAPWRVPGVSDDAANSQAFVSNQTQTVTIGGQSVAFGNYNAMAWAAAGSAQPSSYSIDGNMWAPDVIWNKVMQKWCMYLSVNGDNWASSIILLTSDNIEGPYTYQGPVVFSGFRNTTNAGVSYTKTDMQLVMGHLSALPARYNQGNSWGSYWPNAIDPCVFYDEEGLLWMTYGSWSGGIWMLRLNEQDGLRDYNVSYGSDYDSRKQRMTTDAYFGKRIAGGCYVSGEASYIEHIGDWYYLFVTYGGLNANGGYQMRVFRSANVDGPYTDPSGQKATFDNYVLNFGTGNDHHGEKLFGSYGEWGGAAVGDFGETAQGHNSVITDDEGRVFLVYHTRFHNRGEGHEVRVHQLFQNQDGWLVAAPFEYTGEQATDADLSTSAAFPDADIAGQYELLVHKYSMDHAAMEQVEPVTIVLGTDGTISGDQQGTWQTVAGTSYINLTLGGTLYKGVVVEQQADPTTAKALCFTACGAGGANVWGYKLKDGYDLAYTIRDLVLPIKKNQVISQNINLYDLNLLPNVEAIWTSDKPEIISPDGHYNPSGLTEATDVKLTLRLQTLHYYYTVTTTVKAAKETMPAGDFMGGMAAWYNFDQLPYTNQLNNAEGATCGSEGSALAPTQESDHERLGSYVHQWFGWNGNSSYTEVDNPLYGASTDGFTISFWCKRGDDNAWDALFGFQHDATDARFFLTGNAYLGYNGMDGNWIDCNYPNDVVTDVIGVGQWNFVTLAVSAESGLALYVNGVAKTFQKANGSLNGNDVTSASAFDCSLITQMVCGCTTFCLGKGSFWGSADACFDDLFVHNRALTAADAAALYTMANRVYDFRPQSAPTMVETIGTGRRDDGAWYTISGRRMKSGAALPPAIYIHNGKKIIVK